MNTGKEKNMLAVRRPALALLALTACVAVLAGCSAGDPLPTSSPAVSQRDSGVLGVRICVVNKTPKKARIEWLTFDKADAHPIIFLNAGETTCAEGWQTSLLEDDVTLKVTWPDKLSQIFTAWNQSIGEPQVRVDASKQSAAEACGFESGAVSTLVVCSDGYGINESRHYPAYDYHETTLVRIGDSERNKEFVMTLVK